MELPPRARTLVIPGFALPTYSVSELCAAIQDALGVVLPSVWVAGEAQRVKVNPRGHLYFELVEKGEGDQILGRIEAVIWRTHHQRIQRELRRAGAEIREGGLVRCGGSVEFYGPSGRLQLVVREADPLFALGHLELRRRETLAALAAAGLMERNRQLPLPPVPLRIALVTSRDSAAYHDFLSTLRESGFAFRVLLLHAAVQGPGAEGQVASALAALDRVEVDCVALVRGGGARSDLATFDSRRVAEAVARCSVPVLTGLGHETDTSIADLVAHTALKTPTKVAELLVERARGAQREVTALQAALAAAAGGRLRAAGETVRRVERRLAASRFRLRHASARLTAAARSAGAAAQRRLGIARRSLDAAGRRLVSETPRRIERERRSLDRAAAALVVQARSRLRAAAAAIGAQERLCTGLSPARILARGFSITRGPSGRVLRDPAEVNAGDTITSELAGGALVSRAERREER